MQSKATTVPAYLKEVPEDRLAAIKKLRKTIKDNLPEGFKETMGYGMPAYVVPHKIYPDGYHCDPKLPLPFINFASQLWTMWSVATISIFMLMIADFMFFEVRRCSSEFG